MSVQVANQQKPSLEKIICETWWASGQLSDRYLENIGFNISKSSIRQVGECPSGLPSTAFSLKKFKTCWASGQLSDRYLQDIGFNIG